MGKYPYTDFVLKRDRYRCKICNTNKQRLVAHHIIPVKYGGSHEPWNRVTLCTTCHRPVELGRLSEVSSVRIAQIGKNAKWFKRRLKELGLKTDKNPYQKGYWIKKSQLWKQIKIPRNLYDELIKFRKKNSTKNNKLPSIHHTINYLLELTK